LNVLRGILYGPMEEEIKIVEGKKISESQIKLITQIAQIKLFCAIHKSCPLAIQTLKIMADSTIATKKLKIGYGTNSS